MRTIYPAMAGSPNTTTTSQYAAGANSFTITDGTILPAAPNLVTLYYNNEFVTLLYTVKNANTVGGLTYVEGNSAISFPSGSTASRVWTKYDHDAYDEHIANIETPMSGGLQLTVVPQAISVIKSGTKDVAGNYPVYTFLRADGTKYMVSTLSGATPPLWSTRTVQYFTTTQQTTPIATYIYDLTYDSDEEILSEILRT